MHSGDRVPRFFSLDALVDTPAPPSAPAQAPAGQRWTGNGPVRLGGRPDADRAEKHDGVRKEMQAAPLDTVVLAVLNNKGGVGKTTTVVNVAAALSVRAPVLLIDLDSQGSATLSLGRKVTGVPTLYDVLAGQRPVREAIQTSGVPGLDYIAGGPALVYLQEHLMRGTGDPGALRRALQPLAGAYAYVLMDCAPTFTPLSLQALVASDGCIVPVTPHFLAVEGLKNLIHTIAEIERDTAAVAPIWGIALTMVDNRYPSARRNAEQLRMQYGDLVFQAEIPFNIHLAEAPASGKPIFEYAARSGATRSYWALSKEMARRVTRMREGA